MHNEKVLDHFCNPRNSGRLLDSSAVVEVSNPVCGDLLRLAAQVNAGRIVEARFLCRGCTTAIASASLLTELLNGQLIAVIRSLSASRISEELGGLPAACYHGAELAAAAAAALLEKIRET